MKSIKIKNESTSIIASLPKSIITRIHEIKNLYLPKVISDKLGKYHLCEMTLVKEN